MGTLKEAEKQLEKTIASFRKVEKRIEKSITKIGKDVEKKIDGAVKGVHKAIEPGLELGRYLANLKDQTVPSFTLYIKEDIGIQKFLNNELDKEDRKWGQISAVYVPPSVKAVDKVNVILYLHGDKVRIHKSNFTIREYLNLDEMPLRQGLNTSGQPYVLIAPTLGADADTEFGSLGDNIDKYLDDMLDKLAAFGPPQFAPPGTPQIDKLIIAGHSGGFGPIRSLLGRIKKYKKNIQEIWGFDIMYGNTATKLEEAGVPVYAYFKDTEARSRALASKGWGRIFVMIGADFVMDKGKEKPQMIKHDNLMQRFWLDRCRRIGTNGKNAEDMKRMVHG